MVVVTSKAGNRAEVPLRIEEHHLDYHDGQHDLLLVAKAMISAVLGRLSYSEFQGKAYINLVEVEPQYRRQGVGRELVEHLYRKYGRKAVLWGWTTDEGRLLRAKLAKDWRVRERLPGLGIVSTGKVERVRQLTSYGAEKRHFYRYAVTVDGETHFTGVEVGSGRSEDRKDLRARAVAQVLGSEPEPSPTVRDHPPDDLLHVTHHSAGESQALVDRLASAADVPTATVKWTSNPMYRGAGGLYYPGRMEIHIPATDPVSADTVAHEFAHHIQHMRGTSDGNRHGRSFQEAYGESTRAAREFYGIPRRSVLGSAFPPPGYQGDHGAPHASTGSPLHDLTANGTYPDDVYSRNGLQYYGTGYFALDRLAYALILRLRGKPDGLATVYRAVPSSVPAGSPINPRDWVTTVRQYAVDHGEGPLDGDYRLLQAKVRARDLFTNGDSWLEWGYDPQQPAAGLGETPRQVAALYVARGGAYYGLPGVDPWDEARDARSYPGPYPVVAHPPCQRWGRFWHGSPSKPHQFQKGDDGGCFTSALATVRRWGGVIEHPVDSAAWAAHGLNRPPAQGWGAADFQGGWTAQVEQGHYGHPSRKPTWLYVHGISRPPSLVWGPSSPVGGRTIEKQRESTPPAFRDLLLSLARSVDRPGGQENP